MATVVCATDFRPSSPNQLLDDEFSDDESLAMKFQYSSFDDVEDLEKYEVGGFHPIHLGDEFDGRYRIVHKLGHGGFSTVWLARDLQSERYVAMKFITARSSEDYQDFKIMQDLMRQEPSEMVFKDHFTPLLDHFWLDGPNGHHLCLVSLPLGPTVERAAGDGSRLYPYVARTVALESVRALARLHSQGICHGGASSERHMIH